MNIGQLAATLIPWGTLKAFPDIDDERSFRVPLYVALALPTITLVLELLYLVESPWWLVMRGKIDDARKALIFINKSVPDFDVDEALMQLEYTLRKESEQRAMMQDASYLECFRGTDLRRTFCALFPAITQNLSGQNLVGKFSSLYTAASQTAADFFPRLHRNVCCKSPLLPPSSSSLFAARS